MNAEQTRLEQARDEKAPWKKWGPYLSERQWGTVREDYSENGDAWNFFTHDHARSRAYRWGEDGIAGLSDDKQHLCFALALWNGKDPILKERLFGLTNSEGNHGEDVNLEPIKKFARTLRRHRPLLLNWFRAKKEISSGCVEGLNTNVKLALRKARGFKTYHVAETALYHELGRLPEPDFTHRFC